MIPHTQVLKQLKTGETATIQKYDYNTHQRENQPTTIQPADVILLEGERKL